RKVVQLQQPRGGRNRRREVRTACKGSPTGQTDKSGARLLATGRASSYTPNARKRKFAIPGFSGKVHGSSRKRRGGVPGREGSRPFLRTTVLRPTPAATAAAGPHELAAGRRVRAGPCPRRTLGVVRISRCQSGTRWTTR